MNQIEICILDRAGSFAENKDVARDIRIKEIIPALNRNEKVILNFENVSAATQSFIHALISDLLRKYGNEVLDQVIFKSCNGTIKEIINIVVDYMQE
ncbi:MAG: STAS-like domain-containing protein [Verrucomicrobiota bacterium]